MQDFAGCLISRVREADEQTAPAGLYGESPGFLIENVVVPFIKSRGGKVVRRDRGYFSPVHFVDGKGRRGCIGVLTISAVKVRKFGDRFAVDSRVDHHARWDARKLQKQLCGLWSPAPPTKVGGIAEPVSSRSLLLVAFDAKETPFSKEFSALANEVDWTLRAVTFEQQTWPDARGRSLWSSAAVWSWPNAV